MKQFLRVFLAVLFFANANAQSVTVTQPNGGEVLYGCQNYQIKWTGTGVSNNWNIDYSLNSGAIWTSVASNLNILPVSSVYSYNWTVPMVGSNTVLVRIRDYSDTTKQDVSNAVFTIQLPIVITSPNGGEVWQGLSNHNITWSPAGTSGIFNISYSTNNGTSWNTVASNVAANNYNWTVPNTPTTQALVRVADATTSCQLDISNAVFEISAATPILLTPNGGEIWTVDATKNITWNSTTFHSTVKLEYSTDNGFSYNLITNAAPNTGSYAWNIPNTPSTQVLVRASNTSGSTVFDVSNAVFTIQMPTNLLTSPNGGEVWRSGNTHQITWDNNLITSNVTLEYSVNAGSTWSTITTNASNTGTYNWTIPMQNSTTQALVRITNNTVPIIKDTSNAVFTIKAPITVDYPNTNMDTLTSCSTINIQWSKSTALENYVSGSTCYSISNGSLYTATYELYYSVGGSNSWNNITTVYGTCYQSAYSYAWTVPDVAPGTVRVRVIGRYAYYTSNSMPIYWQDSSDMEVPVKGPNGTIVVTNPNGGVTLNALTNYNVTWTANGTSGFFDVQYSTDGGLSFGSIAGGTNITGNSFNWNVNNTPSTNVFVRVRDNQNICRKDVSNAANTIVAATPILTSPNGGEVWKVNSTQNITWTTNTLYTTVYIEYSTDNGTSWNIVSSAAPNTGSYAWTVPNTVTTQALIRISNRVGGNPSTPSDVSNAVFTINLPTPLLTSPNGGEVWRSGNTHQITWDASTVASNVQLEYSFNGGTSWSTITSSASNTGTFNWTIPMFNGTTTALIRITNTSFPSAIDTSNAVFTIKAPITVDYPNTNMDTLTSCSTINIQWSKSTALENYVSGSTCYSISNGSLYTATYELYYSVGGSNSWNNITTVYGTCYQSAYSYAWTVPDVAPGTVRVRVIGRYAYYTSNSMPIYWQDSSDMEVPVKGPNGTIVVTNPNGGVTLNALTNYNVTWTANGTSGFFDVQYSTDGGLSFGSIAGGTNITGNSFNWNVNNTPSTNVFVRVRDNQNICRKDVSNAANTIVAATPILTSPNGGEVWKVNSTQNITWTTNTLYTTVYIEYSTDNGTSWNIVSSAAPNTGSYAWTVPNTVTTQALIRISNRVGGNPSTPSDVSNAVFTINLPTPLLTSPNGGEVWRSGNLHQITWDASTVASNVQLEYSFNGGTSWSTITTSASNTGTFNWTIPMFNGTTTALIRITNTSFPSAIDTSNAVFTIKAPITVDYPNTNMDTLTSCSTINIQWSKSTALENYVSGSTCYSISNGSLYTATYELYYSVGGSNSWNNITTVYGTCYQSAYSYAWTVPDVAPGTVRVRVIGRYAYYTSNSMPIYWQDSSDMEVPVKGPNGTIVVTNPNGGVTLNALTNYNVTWTANGTSGFFDVQYSTDGGLSFGSIAGGTNITGNSFNWNVNNTPSTNVFVRVRDNQNICRKDVSNAANTIVAATPILTSPNGGEVWKVNSTQNITWTTNTLYTTVYIEYSTDNGTSWNIVSSAAPNTGSYAWTVPNTVTTQALIRISNRVGGNPSTPSDVSNAVFTINLPTPLLTSPNGGEVWRSGNTHQITWDASTVASNVQLEYSFNGGTSWSTITSSASNTGTFNWTIPMFNGTTTALIRITNTSFPSAIDTSNAVFTIKAPITVDYPNTNMDTLTSCSTINIQWSKSTALENYVSGSTCYSISNGSLYTATYELYYSVGGSNSWNNITTVYGTCYQSAYSYAWTVPDVAPGTVRVRVIGRYAYYTSNSMPIYWQDSSDMEVPVKGPNGTIVVTNPNGGVTLNALTNYNVTWTANGTSGFFDVQYSTDGGLSFGSIAGGTNITGNSFNWNVNNTPSTNVFVRVRDNQNICRKDVSNAANTIVAATPILTSPNGGEVWKVNSTQNITWTTNTLYTTVYIEYSTDNGTSWNIVSSAAPNTGSYAWTVPNTVTTQALIRISNRVGGNPSTPSDVSNAVFTINLPTPLLTSPNGGEVWRSGNTHQITWDASTVASNVQLEYSFNGGTSWSTITSSASNTGTFNWTIPMFNGTTTALIRITNTSFPSAIDTSNAVFTIKAPITVDYPNTNMDTLTSCSTINIQWSKSTALENYVSGSTCYSISNGSLYTATYELYYSVGGSNSWNNITTVYGTCYQSAYSYAWTVPDVAPGTVRVRVIGRYAYYTSNSMPIYWQDSSDMEVPVKGPNGTIVVTNPNGGVTLNALTNYNVTWTANGTSGFFDVQYSTNGGVSFSNIAGGTNITGNSFNWNVNNTPSTNVFVRVRDNQNICRKDVSNAANTIVAATPILTSPNGGEVWNVNSTQNITWNAATLYSNAFIEYSTDNGLTWNTVVTSTANTGSYAWTVPFNPSTQVLIRISNVGAPSNFDVSNAVFTIQIPTPILTSPNGGETWYAGTTQAITWVPSSIFSTTVNLYYSLDSGNTWVTIASNLSNTGTYNWVLPDVNSDKAFVKVANSSNTAYYDVNNALFTLRPYVRITNPNGGNQLGACTQTTISFEKAPAYTAFNIEYSIDNGATWTVIQSNTTYTNTFNTYNWTVPNQPTTAALVRVYPTAGVALGDSSDATFTIKRAVTIIQPNFGGVLQVGSVYPIKWQSDGISNIYDIAYSTAGPGGPFTNIILGYNTSTNTYNWTVPNTPSTNCYIRIRDNINSCKEDISDVAFTISTTANPITIVTPNGTDSLNACQNYNITWTEVGGPIGTYNIAYSIDNAVNWIPIITNYATTSYSYNWTVPNINAPNVLVRVQSAPTPTLFDLSDALFKIKPGVLLASRDTTICSGNSVQLNVTGGASYTWTPSTGLSNPTIANPLATPTTTTQYVVSSTSSGCSLKDTVNITVNPSSGLNASLIIAPSPSTAVCSGSNVLFTATPSNGGLTPSYQWKVNGANVGTNTYTYSTTTTANNDVVSCVMTSSLACVTGSPATSNLVTMTVFPNVTPSVLISTPSITICSGANVTFTATPTNGGGAPAYQWKKNGNNISGATANTYTTNTLSNNDVISVELTSNANCASPLVVTSNSLLMTVNPNNTPAITISASLSSICTGQSVTFTANAVNAGTTPVYQWKRNGSNVGTNSSTFTSTTLANNDVITCDVTSSATCNTISTVTSNAITMSVSSSVVPAVAVVASSTNVCAGTAVNFTATPTNGGLTPSYQWKINGINAGTNSNTFSSSALANNDVVTCVMTSSSGCASPTTATSTGITMTINPTTAPSVTVTTSAGTICAGSNVTFTANATNAGATPSYQWKLNSGNVGGNANTFNTSGLANNDTVWCVVTSSSSCAVPNTTTSNKLVTIVNAVVTPSVSISANNNNVCASTSVLFTATPTNGGSTPAYQWKVNGGNVGTNSATFGSTTLANNDVVTCVLTSNVACATTTTATSNAVTMTVTPTTAPSITISTAATTVCSGTSVTFTASTTNGGGTPTFQWKKNGSNISGATASSYSTTTLANADAISCVLTSSALCSSPASASSNTINMTVNSSVTPSVTITASTTSICSGNTVTFTATPVNGGTTPAYQWKVNGTNAGTNSVTYASSTLTNNDVVTCVMTSNALCASTTTATSNAITMAVNAAVTPTVSINTSSTTICSGTSVTFNATVSNGGGAPTYVWKKNGTPISGATTSSYTTTTLANNDIITLDLTSSAACASPLTVSSNPITMTVTSSVTASISIVASSTNICTGTSVTFTATPTNGGSTPVYQWKVNGGNVGTNSTTFTTTTLSNNDVVSCVLTSNAACVTSSTVTSNTVTMTVTTPAAATVTISAGNTICAGTSASFTASVTNAGTSPVYQWKVNGSNVGTNSSSFSSTTLANGDLVTCQFTSTNGCSGASTVNSNTITMAVSPSVVPDVTVAASSTSICAGQNVTFTATPTNGGASPTYQWLKNGAVVGTNSSTYASTALVNNDVVKCVLTSNAGCAVPSNDTSNAITITVGSNATPVVSIGASATSICNGTAVTFTATPTNGGTTPAYQWKVNGTNAGTNSASFTTSTLANGDVVTCVMTSNATCVSTTTVTSNAITIIVNAPVAPTVSMSASATSICSGQSVTFTATPTNGGTTPAYQWKLNGSDVGTNATTYSNSALGNGDVVTVVMTSSATCTTVPTATATPVTITVNPSSTPDVTIAASQTSICAGSAVTFTATPVNGGSTPVYQWFRNTTVVGTNSATLSTSTISNNDVFSCVLTSNVACASKTKDTSNTITMTVNAAVTPSVSITASATTICAGATVNFTATPVNGGTSPSYQWKVNGSNSGSNTPTFSSTSLVNGDVVSCVLTSNAACATPASIGSNNITIVVSPAVTPAVTVSASASSICSGQAVTFTATPTNGGTTPAYQWKLNGSDVGTNATTYSNSALGNGDVVTVVMTSSATCTTVPTATATPVTITVNPSSTPDVTIAASQTSICAGSAVTFTATPVNGGSTPVYQWFRNTTVVGTNSATLSTSTISNNDVFSCVLTSNVACASKTKDTSNTITMTVNAAVTPSVSITASATTICAGATVTFTATPVNGGTSPSYQWKVNGSNSGSNTPTFSSTSLVNGDVVSCVLTSNAACATPASIGSNNITIVVSPAVTPAVTVSASASSICSGQAVTFTATPTNGGTTPAYQWKLNGSDVGTNATTYSNSALGNGDVVTVVMTSSATCTTVPTATATPVTITVNPSSTPDVTIAASQTSICAGSAVTFTATPVNGGTTPVYQWFRNTTVVGTNSATLSTSTISNNDVFSCVLTSNVACASKTKDTSNTITMTVNAAVTPSVSITASATTICAGATVNFTATPVNGGTSPSYQWKVNGSNSGSNTPTFSSTSLVNGDVVSCVLTSNAACATPASIGSNNITIVVSPAVTPAVSVSPSTTNTCTGQLVTFTAVPTNGGSTPAYQWKLNGSNVGTNSASYSSSTLNNGDVITVVMTSSASCPTVPTATATPVTMTVNPASAPDVTIATSANNVCTGTSVVFTATPTNGGTSPAYQWLVNGVNTATGVSFTSNTLTNGALVKCILTATGACISPNTDTSNVISMVILPSVVPSVSISASSTAVCTGTSITFTATSTNGGTAPTYQWKVNGSNAATGTTFITSTLSNGDIVSCELTSNANCASPAVVTSNNITVTISSPSTPAVSVSASATTICTGQSITFTATPSNGGTSPVYQWKVNGSNVGTNATVYSSSTWNNGDVVTCEMTSNAACISTPTVISTPITITVNTASAPTIAISTPTTSVCSGSSVVFTASITNGGTTPVYQWKVNTVNSGTNSATFTSSSLTNGAVVNCVLTSSSACATPTTATSNSLTMNVSTAVTPTIAITSSSTNICAGTAVTFTATATNAGATPVYRWKVNGTITGGSSSTLVTSSLSNNDIVTCELTSSLPCVTSATVLSNSIVVTVNPIVTPTVTVNASATNICQGTSVTFTALPTNAGTSPTYQWKLNGTNVGSNSNTYSNAALNNGDVVTVTMTITNPCGNPTAVTSTPITILVSNASNPSVTISANPGTTICSGASVVFNASPTNAGSSPVYQWKVNGVNVGTNSPTFTANQLTNGAVVTCVMTSSFTCVPNPTATSNALTITVNATPTSPVVTSNSPVCENAQLILNTAPVAGATYSWSGPNGTTYSTQDVIINGATTANAGVYTLNITLNGCSASSLPTNVTVNAVPVQPTITKNGTVLTSSVATNVQWMNNNTFIVGATSSTYTATQTGYFQVRVSNASGCYSVSDSMYVFVTAINDINITLKASIYPNPFTNKFSMTIPYEVKDVTEYSFEILNDIGQVVLAKSRLEYVNQIDLSNVAAGMYYMKVKYKDSYKTFKLMKKE